MEQRSIVPFLILVTSHAPYFAQIPFYTVPLLTRTLTLLSSTYPLNMGYYNFFFQIGILLTPRGFCL